MLRFARLPALAGAVTAALEAAGDESSIDFLIGRLKWADDRLQARRALTRLGAPALLANLTVGTLAPGASQPVSMTVTAPSAPGTYTVTATASTSDPEADTTNNSTTASRNRLAFLSPPRARRGR